MNNTPIPVRARLYAHQQEAFAFACRLCGLAEGGDSPPSMSRNSCALLMEM